MPKFSPHPFSRSGQICVTRRMNGPQIYPLPEGLEPGVLVKTLRFDGAGNWDVMEVETKRQWSVYVILLEVPQRPSGAV